MEMWERIQALLEVEKILPQHQAQLWHRKLPGAWGEGCWINRGCGCQESQTPIPAWQNTMNREFNLFLCGFLCYPGQGLQGGRVVCTWSVCGSGSQSLCCPGASCAPRPHGWHLAGEVLQSAMHGFIYPFFVVAVVSLWLEGSLPCKKSQENEVFLSGSCS